jgi:hypothetical protein
VAVRWARRRGVARGGGEVWRAAAAVRWPRMARWPRAAALGRGVARGRRRSGEVDAGGRRRSGEVAAGRRRGGGDFRQPGGVVSSPRAKNPKSRPVEPPGTKGAAFILRDL